MSKFPNSKFKFFGSFLFIYISNSFSHTAPRHSKKRNYSIGCFVLSENRKDVLWQPSVNMLIHMTTNSSIEGGNGGWNGGGSANQPSKGSLYHYLK